MTTASKLVGKLTITAAQIQQVILRADPFEGAQHPWLQTLPRGRELQCKGLVELPVELEQTRKRGRIHAGIIA